MTSPSQPSGNCLLSNVPVNAAELLERVDGDRALLSELLELFREEFPGQVGIAREAIARRDGVEVGRIAHTLVGSLGNLSAIGARTFAAELEAMGRSGDLAMAGAKLEELGSEVHRAISMLEALSMESG
jgi:HPt (histidine-containing phosphotransfer) domain-containing protein